MSPPHSTDSIVVGAPVSLRALAGTLRDGGESVEVHARGLGAAAAAFAAGRPDFGRVAGALADDITARLIHQGAAVTRLGDGVADLAAALEVADRSGVGGPLGALGSGSGVVVIDEALLATFDVGPDSSLDALHDALRRRLAILVAAHGRPGTFASAADLAMAARIASLERLVAQLDAIVSGRPEGWAAVGEEHWFTAGGFLAATALGNALGVGRLTEVGAGLGTEPDAFVVDWAFGAEHPFLWAAQRHGVAITPARYDVLVELDRLVGLPIEAFLDERERGLGGAPRFDWSSDQCSGPVLSSAGHACFRHDFFYRNGRMLRDQWGLPPGFAEDLKDVADDRFAREVLDATPRWPPRPELIVWGHGVGAAVTVFGSVSEPWSPPD